MLIHICYEGPILLMRFLSFHCALNCSLGCFSIPKCAAFGLKGWNLTQNSSVQSVKKSPWQEKKVLEREGLEIGHLRGNLTSSHNTCEEAFKQFMTNTLGKPSNENFFFFMVFFQKRGGGLGRSKNFESLFFVLKQSKANKCQYAKRLKTVKKLFLEFF